MSLNQLINDPQAIATLESFKDNSDPKYIGPGTWNIIHKQAFLARTHKQQLNFIILMKAICYEFPCNACKTHCTKYIELNPMEDYLDTKVEINGENLPLGMFIWSWKFHNAVNSRINKPIMSWDTAYNLYSDSQSLVCSKSCTEAKGDITPIKTKKSTGIKVSQPFRFIPVY